MPIQKGNRPVKNKSGLTIKKERKDPEAKIATVHVSEKEKLMIEKPFQCVTCGKRYTRQKGNFSYSQSPLFIGNNHFLPTCSACVDDLVEQYTEMLGSQNEAMKRVCMHFDIYVSDSMLNSAKRIDVDKSCIKNYIKQCNLTQNAGKTYDTYLREQKTDAIHSEEDYKELKERGEVSIPLATIERFGVDLGNEADYKILDEHYKMLKKQNPNCDSNQEIFIKDLCYIKLQQVRAMKNDDYDKFEKTLKNYRETFKQAGLKTVQDEDKNADDCWGVWMERISQFTPEEYYKAPKMYKDYEGIGEIFKRFVGRPLSNLLLKQNVRDFEYNVEDNHEDD